MIFLYSESFIYIILWLKYLIFIARATDNVLCKCLVESHVKLAGRDAT